MSDEELSEEEVRSTLEQTRDLLERLRPLLSLWDDFCAWSDRHRVEIRDKAPVVDGTTNCRVCHGEIAGVPTTCDNTARVHLNNDHRLYVDVRVSSTLPSLGAVCGQCLTYTLLALITNQHSWAAERFGLYEEADGG